MIAWRPWNAREARLAHSDHVRIDRPTGKAVIWRPALSETQVDRLEDLVYVAQSTLDTMPHAYLVVTEGEKGADAVSAAGHPAVATVCGASSVPGSDVVAWLGYQAIVLWPDHDRVGFDHMGRLGKRLEDVGVPWLAIVRPLPGSPPGWDAADASPGVIRMLIDDAIRRPIGPVRR